MVEKDLAQPRKTNQYIGHSVKRLEDPPLVVGRARFVGDLNFQGQLHARIVRSPVASGTIVSIDIDAARALPGVVAVWTGQDLVELPPIPFRATAIKGLTPYCQPALAQKTVRYVGEPIAVIFADTPYTAEDAADLVLAEVDEREPYLDATSEPAQFGPGLSCEPTIIEKGYGDVDEVFAAADVVIELELNTGRHSAVPMETRGLLARYDTAREVLELHGAAKRPHWNRDQLADLFKLSPGSIELYENSIGGGFGVRGELYPEDLILCQAALTLKRPVKWIEDRREHLMATNHSREQTHRIRAAVDEMGRILALDETLFHDQGAYVRTHGARVADMTIGLLLGPYRVPAYRARAHYRLTNKTPAATYRAPGRFEGTFVRERMIEAIAERLSLDPMEVRRANLIGSAEMPFERGLSALETEVVLDSGDYAGLIEKALDFAGWAELRKQVDERRARGECAGLGFGLFVEKSGLGPSELVEMRVEMDGCVTVVTGASSLGQGMETAIAQICAETLGVNYRSVRVLHGDTNRIAYGFGAHASRVTVMTGEATRRASVAVRDKALDLAAELLQREVSELEIVDGTVRAGEDGPSITIGEIARHLHPASASRGDREPGLSSSAWFHSKHMNYPYGAHIAQVLIDKATGHVKVERYAIAYDVGRAVNPAMIEGQIVGGLAQGLGGALYEEFLYDEGGQPLSVTLADYKMVSATEMPPVDVLILEDAPSPLNPLGLKGAGEGGVNAAGAAIASAVDDALQRPGLVDRLPVTPQYLRRRLQAYDEARSGSTEASA